MENLIDAPIIPAGLSPEKFNEWRQVYDYPRIIQYFMNEHPEMKTWMDEFNIDTNDLIVNSPAVFLGNKGFFTYRIFQNQTYKGIDKIYLDRSWHEKHTVFKKEISDGFGTKRLYYIKSFVEWMEEKTKSKFHLYTSSGYGPSGAKLGNLELLDLRSNYGYFSSIMSPLDNRYQLDFCNLAGCQFIGFSGSQTTRMWFSNLEKTSFSGSMTFFDIHSCHFGGLEPNEYVKFNEGDYQDWVLSETDLFATMGKCNLSRWQLINSSFDGIFTNVSVTEIDATFDSKYHGFDSKYTFRKLKRLYSEVYDFDSASEMHIKEKRAERKSMQNIYSYFNSDFLPFRKPIRNRNTKTEDSVLNTLIFVLHTLLFYLNPKVSFIYLKGITKYFLSLCQDVLWGYGTRPYRVLGWSFLTVFILFPLIYFIHKTSPTISDFSKSIYFSLITFTTLGYGDICPSNDDTFLQLACGCEALIGIVFMTLVVSAFISTSSK